MELELLEPVEGGAPKPDVQSYDAEAREVQVVLGDGETAAGTSVLGENARDPGCGDLVGAEGGVGIRVHVDAERSGAPDVAPAGGEDLRAAAVSGGEKGDDVADDGVREAADLVLEALFIFFQSSPPLGSGDHRHVGMVARPPAGFAEPERPATPNSTPLGEK